MYNNFILIFCYNSLMLHDKLWKPSLEELSSAKREALNVATLLDVTPITGPDATKERFLKEIEKASVVHIGLS